VGEDSAILVASPSCLCLWQASGMWRRVAGRVEELTGWPDGGNRKITLNLVRGGLGKSCLTCVLADEASRSVCMWVVLSSV
jgi:hypothetical protein